MAESELEDLPGALHTGKFSNQLEPSEDDFSPASHSVWQLGPFEWNLFGEDAENHSTFN